MNKEIKEELRKIEVKKQEESALALVASILPWAGSAITQAINTHMSALEEKRFSLMIEGVKRDIKDLRITIDKEYIKTETFSAIFETAYKVSINSKSKKKIEYIKNAFVYGLNKAHYDETMEFFNTINDLEDIHLTILKRCWDQFLLARKLGSPTTPFVDLVGLVDYIKNVPKRVIERAGNYLITIGLFENPTTNKVGAKNGVYTLTDSGVSFIENIIKEDDNRK